MDCMKTVHASLLMLLIIGLFSTMENVKPDLRKVILLECHCHLSSAAEIH
jgi:hypothetical protein